MNRSISHIQLALLTCCLLGADAGQADICRTEKDGLGDGPLSLTMQPAAFGSPRRACPRTEVGLTYRSSAIAEIGPELLVGLAGPLPQPLLDALHGKEQFYVNGQAGFSVAISYALSERLELFGAFEAMRVQFLRASYTASSIGLGHTTAGATIRIMDLGPATLGVTTRLTLPTALGHYENAWPITLDSGLVFLAKPLSFLRLHGHLGASGAYAITRANPDPRAGLMAVVGAELIPFSWLSLVADLNGRALYDAELDHLALALGARAHLFGGLGIEAGSLLPFAGSERSLGAVFGRIAYRLR